MNISFLRRLSAILLCISWIFSWRNLVKWNLYVLFSGSHCPENLTNSHVSPHCCPSLGVTLIYRKQRSSGFLNKKASAKMKLTWWYFLSKVNIWNINCVWASALIFETQMDVFVKVTKFLRLKISRPEGDSYPQPLDSCPNALTTWVIRARHLLQNCILGWEYCYITMNMLCLKPKCILCSVSNTICYLKL